jgi:hypothetical protein
MIAAECLHQRAPSRAFDNGSVPGTSHKASQIASSVSNASQQDAGNASGHTYYGFGGADV